MAFLTLVSLQNYRKLIEYFSKVVITAIILFLTSMLVTASCGASSQPDVERCSFMTSVMIGLNELGQIQAVYSGSDKRVYVVTFIYGAAEKLSADNMVHMIMSLKLSNPTTSTICSNISWPDGSGYKWDYDRHCWYLPT